MLKNFLSDKIKKLILGWLETAGRELLNKLFDDFLKNLAQAQGAPAGASHLVGPEVDEAKKKTIDSFLG